MITPIVIGQILGISFFVVALSMIINKRNAALVIEKMTRDNARLWMGGFLSILTGTTLLGFSNFSTTISTLVALLGILAFAKGIFMMWFPKAANKFYSRFTHRKFSMFLAGVVLLVVSIILIISSF